MEKKQSRYHRIIARVKKDNPSVNNSELSKLIANEIKKVMPVDKGEPLEPMNTTNKITDPIRTQANNISGRRKGLLVQFIRSKRPELVGAVINLQAGKIDKVYSKSPPIGALVAFTDGPEIVLGWSKYNKAKEVAAFTKKDATLIAIVRALTDGVKDNGNGCYVTSSDVIIPKAIDKEINAFAARASTYFGGSFRNVKGTFA